MLKNVNIKQKLFGFAGVSIAVSLIIALIGYWGISVLTTQLADNTRIASALRNHLEADMMHDALRADVLAAMRLGNAADTNAKAELRKDFEEHLVWFRSRMDANKKLDLTNDIKNALDSVGGKLELYIKSAENIVGLAFKDAAAANAAFPSFKESFELLEDKMSGVSDSIETLSVRPGTL